MARHHGRHAAHPTETPPAQQPQWGHVVQVDSHVSEPPEETPTATPKRRKRRVFVWVFLVVQLLFLIWLISALVVVGGAPDAASGAGATIGAGLIVAFWVAVDFILAVSCWIYRVAKRD